MFNYYIFEREEIYNGFVDTDIPEFKTERNNAASYTINEYKGLPPISIIAAIVKHNIDHNIKSFPNEIQTHFDRFSVGSTLSDILSYRSFKSALHLNNGNEIYTKNCQEQLKVFETIRNSIPCYGRPFNLNIFTNDGDIYSYAFKTKEEAIEFCNDYVITHDLLTAWDFVHEQL